MSYPPDILNPESLAEVLIESCTTAVIEDPQGAGNIERLGALVELLVMYIPLDQYTKVLDEFAAQPEGKELPAAVKAVADASPKACPKCGGCGSVSVPGELHDVFCPACRGTGSEDGGDFDNDQEEPVVRITNVKQMLEVRDARPCPKCGATIGKWCEWRNRIAGKNLIHQERLH